MQTDLEAELEFHREMARGAGNPLPVGRIREEAYDLWRFTLVEDALRDAFIGARMLARTPIFTLFSALVLAVGIGANLTAFSLISAVISRPLNIPNADRFVRIYGSLDHPETGGYMYAHRDEASSFVDIAGYHWLPSRAVRVAGTNGAQNELTPTVGVTGNLFRTVGVSPQLGRLLTNEDAQVGAAKTVVLSDEGWEHYFGRDPQVLGRTLFIEGEAYSIVGVAPVSFTDVLKITREGWSNPFDETDGPRFFMPYEPGPGEPSCSGTWTSSGLERCLPGLTVNLVGRLKPGISGAAAESLLTKIMLGLPQRERYSINVVPGNTLGPPDLWAFLALLAAIGLPGLAAVLIIACDNIAILLSAKTEQRRREIGIRLALGASRLHLIRQLIAENLLLSVLGGAGAMIISLLTARIIERLPLPFSLPGAFDVTFNWRVLLFATVVSFATTILFGWRPALQAVRKDVVASLNPANSSSYRRSAVRSNLVVAQITVSAALLITTFVLVKSQRTSIPSERMPSARRVLIASFLFPLPDNLGKSFSSDRAAFDRQTTDVIGFYEKLLLRLEEIPQIASASVAAVSPARDLPNGLAGSAGVMAVRAESGGQAPSQTNIIMGGYFKTLDIPRLAGRDFNSMDRTGSALVAIVNDTLAERLWPNQNPINLKFDRPDGSAVEVVGLVHDGNGDSRGSALPFVYFPLLQNPNPMRVHASVVVVRSAGFDATSITGLVQRTAFDLDDQTAAFNVHTLQNEFDAAFLPNRIAMYVAGAPGILAFLLSVIGAYGTMALLTAQRRREIGIRIALGAHPSNAVAMMMKEAMKWTAAGISLGVLGALGLLWALNREFAGNSHILRFDSSAFAFGIIVLAVTAATACYIPVKRASRLNPIEVLRNE